MKLIRKIKEYMMPRLAEAEQLAALWEPQAPQASQEPLEAPDSAPTKAVLKRRAKAARRAQKVARKMMRLAKKGKMPLASLFHLAFPGFGWQPVPSKTDLEPIRFADIPTTTLAEHLETLKDSLELYGQWSGRIENMCTALVAALVFLENDDQEGAMMVLGVNFRTFREDAEAFLRRMRNLPFDSAVGEIPAFMAGILSDPHWSDCSSGNPP